jgi:dTDP-4-dehydrorhamnose reductase
VKVLITGAAGQLGRALASELTAEAVALTRRELDVTRRDDVERVLRTQRPDVVVNASAYNAVDAAETDRDRAFAVNAEGPGHLAQTCASLSATLVHVSTDYVFDGTTSAPYDEDAAPNPRSVYGRSKLAGEQAVCSANPSHYVVRTAWVYAAIGKNFPLTIIELAKKGGVRVVNDQTGSPTYAPHLARGIVRLIQSKAPFGTYHIAGSGSATWYELTLALFERLGIRAGVTPVTTADFPRPAPRPAYSALVSRREPRIELPPWRDGLQAFAAELARR